MPNPEIVKLCDEYIARSRARLEKLRSLRDEALQCGATEEQMEKIDSNILNVELSTAEFMFERKQAL